MNDTNKETTMKLILILIPMAFAVSWVVNMVKLFNCDFKAPYKGEVVYVMGALTPACIVTAWMDIE